MFLIATNEEIKSGQVTDVYLERTKQILAAKNINKKVKAEISAKKNHYPWAIFAGLEEVCYLFEGIDVSIRSLAEGTVLQPGQPVMEIEGYYQDFVLYETPLLGLLCQASGIATKAARCKKAAGNRRVINFGARRMHPAISPLIDRNAYIGGCDGVSTIKSAEMLGMEPSGTMPHAFILITGSTVEASKAFHDIIAPHVARVVLVDTFRDEKFESIEVAKALGDDLYAVRLDTPRSRRGNFLDIIKEVRWELDLRGFNNVKIIASGGLDENDILNLNEYVDAYGIGSCISNAPAIDYSMDIVEIEGDPIAKKGKSSGSKDVLKCPSCHQIHIVPFGQEITHCPCGGHYKTMQQMVFDKGKTIRPIPTPENLREYVLEQLNFVEL